MKALFALVPPKVRLVVYAVASAALVVYGIWQAAEGDLEDFVVALVTAAVTTLAGGNVDVPDEWGGDRE